MNRPLRNRVFVLILATLMMSLLLCPQLSAYAADAPTIAKQKVRVGYFAFDGYHMTASDGTKSGYGYDLVQDIARYNNWDIEYVGYDKSWSEMQKMLADGEIDLLTSAQKTTDREAQFAFSAEDVGTSQAMLTVKSGDTRFSQGDYQGYDGMRIGMIENNSRNNDLATFAADKGFTYTPVYFGSTQALIDALQEGSSVDAVLTSSLRSTKNEWILEEFAPSSFYAMVRKDDSALLEQVDSAIAQLDLDMPGWRNDLNSKYYTVDSGDALSFNGAERAFLKQLSDNDVVLKVAVNPDNPPYSYLDSDGTIRGVLPTVFEQTASKMGIAYRILPARTRSDYDELVSSGTADIVMDSNFSLYQAEQNGYKITDPYLTVALSRLTRRDSTREIHTVCLPADIADIVSSQAASSSDSSLEFVTKSSADECVDAVLNGTCDAAYLYNYSASYHLYNDVRNRLSILPLPQYSIDISYAVSSNLDTRLVTILDAGSHDAAGDAKQELLAQGETSGRTSGSFIAFLYDYPILVIGGLLIISALIVFLVIALSRSRNAKLERRRRAELERALNQAQRANEAKSVFLSSMSHDMRTPLNGILGFTDLALHTTDETLKQDYLGKIRSSGGLMLDLVNDTLDLSKIESGKMVLENENVDMQALFETLTTTMNLAAEGKGIEFVTDLEVGDARYVLSDRLKLQQIMLNLLSNAMKYTPEHGRVGFSVRCTGERDGKCDYLMTIEDNGIGMSKDFLQKMYDPFTQERSKAAKDVIGTGLGLSIVKNVTELMGGSIEAESELGKGTTFRVFLTFTRAERQQQDDDTSAHETTCLKGKRVLLCEDNLLNTEIAQTLLENQGIKVVHAKDGVQGLQAFINSEPGYFDAILMDLRMPNRNGYDTALAIRSSSREDARSVPIIAMSADAYAEDIARCLAVGMDSHIAKPVDARKLIDELSKWICA